MKGFIDFADPADRVRHDRMVALVEEMISLHRLLAAARTDHERTNLKHRINAADRRIDRLIDDVYSNVAPVWAERTSWA